MLSSIPYLLFSLLTIGLVLSQNVTSIQKQVVGNVADVLENSQSMREEAFGIREEAVTIREEAHDIRNEAQDIREEAYSVIGRAYRIKDETQDSRTELEEQLVEAISFVMEELAQQRKSQASATVLYIQEIRNTLNRLEEKIEIMETKVGTIEETVGTVGGKANIMEEKIGTIQDTVSSIEEKGEETAAATNTVKSRLQVWMSEVRLISLYKIAEQTSTSGSHGADLAVDGQFIFDRHTEASMQTYSHTNARDADNMRKLWIELGGFFRIYKIKIWNIRHCCEERLVGTHIYADDRLIGVVTTTLELHEFVIPSQDAVYASRITLQQGLDLHLHVLEVQTWGTGPYAPDDLFD